MDELTLEKRKALAHLLDQDPDVMDDLLRQLQNIAGTTKEQRGIAEARMLIRQKSRSSADSFFDGLSATLTKGSYEYHL